MILNNIVIVLILYNDNIKKATEGWITDIAALFENGKSLEISFSHGCGND